MGTYLTLMNNCGFSEEKAKQIEANYHRLYTVSDNWVKEHLLQATKDGYITTGFGLRVRTPLLKLAGANYESNHVASAEGRTAGNALGQGWGVLNDRARNEVIERIDAEGYSYDILPVAAIHDASYYLVRNDIDTILWLNQAVVKAAKWQDHPVIAHPEVGLSGQLDLFFPDWSNPITLPEDCDEETLMELICQYS